MASRTFTVRGHKIRTTSQRVFAVVAVREEPITMDVYTGFRTASYGEYAARTFYSADAAESAVRCGSVERIEVSRGTFVAFAEIIKRSDSYATATKVKEREVGKHGPGTKVVIVDTTTGEEV